VSRVLVVEDEAAIREAVAYALRREGLDVVEVERADEATDELARTGFDLVVLDLLLPDGSGLDLCRNLRAETDVPIIIVSARVEEVDRIIGLELGADDYLPKPFSMAELVSRVRAQLRRRQLDRRDAGAVRHVGGLRLDLALHEAWVDGRRVQLTPSEFRILSLLASDPGRVFDRDEIMRHLWSSEFTGGRRACDQHVVALRRKLESDPHRPRRLLTVRGVGYRLRAV
jgi:two-component system response regulator RegX3